VIPRLKKDLELSEKDLELSEEYKMLSPSDKIKNNELRLCPQELEKRAKKKISDIVGHFES
jgi:hypothetical protein